MSKLDDIILEPALWQFDDYQKAKQEIKDLMLELIGDVYTYKSHEMNIDGWKEYKRKQFSMKEMDEALHVQCRELRKKVEAL